MDNSFLKQLKMANGLLKSLQTKAIMSQMTDEQRDRVNDALKMSDPAKIKKEAEKLINLNKN